MSWQRFAFTAPSLGAPAVEAIRGQLLDLADASRGAGLELDLRRVGFLGASALGLFVALDKRLRAGGGRLALRGVHPWLVELFAVTRLDEVLDIRQRPESCPLPRGAYSVAGRWVAIAPGGRLSLNL
jgi:anti-anti-sigma factor